MKNSIKISAFIIAAVACSKAKKDLKNNGTASPSETSSDVYQEENDVATSGTGGVEVPLNLNFIGSVDCISKADQADYKALDVLTTKISVLSKHGQLNFEDPQTFSLDLISPKPG